MLMNDGDMDCTTFDDLYILSQPIGLRLSSVDNSQIELCVHTSTYQAHTPITILLYYIAL